MGEDAHGWIALNGFDKPLWLGWVQWFVFGSALVCAMLGVLMMKWVPVLAPEMVRNLWVLTYFFIWIDTVLALSLEYQTYNFIIGLLLGLLFLFLFFHLIRVLGYFPQAESYVPDWKSQAVHYWTWGWMSFYFSLSLLLVFESYKYADSRFAFSFGALAVCFLNYIFSLFLNKAEGNPIEGYSKKGKMFFVIWFLILLVGSLSEKWIF